MCCSETQHLCWDLIVPLRVLQKSDLFGYLKLYLVYLSVMYLSAIFNASLKSVAQCLAF